jgi:hypothetical protein
MEDLLGVPYHLYVRQSETESGQAANCLSAVIHALRRAGYNCPAHSFRRFRDYWDARNAMLQPGITPVAAHGMLLYTREHFLLLHTDSNANGVVDDDDLVIHAYYRPVAITSIRTWREHSPNQPIRYVPVDEHFACPGAEAPLQSGFQGHSRQHWGSYRQAESIAAFSPAHAHQWFGSPNENTPGMWCAGGEH